MQYTVSNAQLKGVHQRILFIVRRNIRCLLAYMLYIHRKLDIMTRKLIKTEQHNPLLFATEAHRTHTMDEHIKYVVLEFLWLCLQAGLPIRLPSKKRMVNSNSNTRRKPWEREMAGTVILRSNVLFYWIQLLYMNRQIINSGFFIVLIVFHTGFSWGEGTWCVAVVSRGLLASPHSDCSFDKKKIRVDMEALYLWF